MATKHSNLNQPWPAGAAIKLTDGIEDDFDIVERFVPKSELPQTYIPNPEIITYERKS